MSRKRKPVEGIGLGPGVDPDPDYQKGGKYHRETIPGVLLGAGEAMPLPAEDIGPSPAELTQAVVDARADVEAMTLEWARAERDLARSREALSSAIDAKARSVGRGNLCQINGVTYRATAPRKPRGAPEDQAALWTLEKVEVAG